ncbi:MAG TPA: transcriptional repressor [Candidatus Hydrogenedentes bacterium]|nr:transcriptional repressor [Candidatus Hydrogenedentota bacterium]
MTVPSDMLKKRMALFREACVRQRLRVTCQRMEIFRAVASSEAHPDVQSIHRTVRKRIPTISPDTVYRNLKLLAEHGLVSVVGMSHEHMRFDANMDLHHHFVCVRCGLIRDFCSEHTETMTVPAEAESFGVPISLRLEVKGICSACQQGKKRR